MSMPLAFLGIENAVILHPDGREEPMRHFTPLDGYSLHDSVRAALPPGSILEWPEGKLDSLDDTMNEVIDRRLEKIQSLLSHIHSDLSEILDCFKDEE